ncbi:MAG: aminotransferase class III-fold pyridoxal phosphate-dependent enzyme, partial [Planctomycetota bacterium]|nr:aminotransferase class III-fold pyridoxal phosphate-dependent enzyme [Planctomycetota bacterium]
MAVRELEVYARLALDVVAAEGSELVLADGRRVLDLYGGHCVNTLGAADEEVAGAFGEQWRRLSFVTNLLDHPPREAFVEALGANLPPGEWRVFLGNSGAEANEAALKLVRLAAGPGRYKIISFNKSFHGRTMGGLSLTP